MLRSGRVRTHAGSSCGASGKTDGAGKDALFHTPTGVACLRSGAVYVCDRGNNCLRLIAEDRVSTCPFNELKDPRYVAVDPSESRLFVTTKNGIYVHCKFRCTLRAPIRLPN